VSLSAEAFGWSEAVILTVVDGRPVSVSVGGEVIPVNGGEDGYTGQMSLVGSSFSLDLFYNEPNATYDGFHLRGTLQDDGSITGTVTLGDGDTALANFTMTRQ
jgi:hypothetical protein